MIADVEFLEIKSSSKIIKVPSNTFKINKCAINLYEKYKTSGYITYESIESIDMVLNVLRGYEFASRSPLIKLSKLACLLGITSNIVININYKEFLLEKQFMVDNFEYFQLFFENYKYLDPDYSSIQIDRSEIIFQFIINHIRGNKLDLYTILNYLPDIKSDAIFFGYKNLEKPFDYNCRGSSRIINPTTNSSRGNFIMNIDPTNIYHRDRKNSVLFVSINVFDKCVNEYGIIKYNCQYEIQLSV